MNDPVINELRRVRLEISQEVGINLEGLVERYAKLESRFKKPACTPQDRGVWKGTEVTLPPVSVGQSTPATR